jgi:hypothetical protein
MRCVNGLQGNLAGVALVPLSMLPAARGKAERRRYRFFRPGDYTSDRFVGVSGTCMSLPQTPQLFLVARQQRMGWRR